MPEYVLNVLTPLPPTFPNGWFSSWNPRRKLYLFLFQGAPEFFTLLFFTNLPYWYLIASILEPFLSRFLKLLESKLKPEASVVSSPPITSASILHLLGGILMLLYIVATEPTAIIPDLFRIYKIVDKICYLLFVLVFSILFVANFTVAIFLWRCLKYGDKITVLVFISAVYTLLPWAYPMVIARISAAVSIIPFILVVKRPRYQEICGTIK